MNKVVVKLTVRQASNSSKSSDGNMRHITIHAEDEVKRSCQYTSCSITLLVLTSPKSYKNKEMGMEKKSSVCVIIIFKHVQNYVNIRVYLKE